MKRWMPAVVALAGLGGGAAAAGEPAGVGNCQTAGAISPELRREILTARERVWRAWFANDREELEIVIPEETVAIGAGDGPWETREVVLEGARKFAESGARLVRLEYPRTEIRLYGDVAILYTTYLFEVESRDGKRETSAGRGTEIFVRRNGRWVNPGWHLDSGK